MNQDPIKKKREISEDEVNQVVEQTFDHDISENEEGAIINVLCAQ